MTRPIFDTATPWYNPVTKQQNTADTVVAEVEGRAVTLGAVSDAIRALPESMVSMPFADVYPIVLSQLIRQEALVIKAQRQKLDEDPVVRRKVRQAEEMVLANEMLVREVSATITEAELLDRYNKDVAAKPGPDEIHLRVIMIPEESKAKAVIAELKGGADFATLAQRYSKDATASRGGDAGFTTFDKLIRDVAVVAFSMQPGTFTPYPVRGGDTWFVLKVDERRPQPAPAYPFVREELRQAILRERVPGAIAAAVADVKVRSFDFMGADADASMGRPKTGMSD
jgi:peptidyl-prolyl cis-trans isomerase C